MPPNLSYGHANLRDRSDFDDIRFCVIDTTKSVVETFLRDMDRIEAYGSYDADLIRLKEFRSHQYYFGEYLSQGTLNIQDKCKMVSASAMIDNGLFTLQPRLREFAKWSPTPRPPWAKAALNLRRELNTSKMGNSNEETLQALTRMARLFGPYWNLPIVTSFASCSSLPGPSLQSFIGMNFTGVFLLTLMFLR